MTLLSPSDVTAPPVRTAGGDNEVPRDYRSRPMILVVCDKCQGRGYGISEKTGKQIKCPGKCGGTMVGGEPIPTGMKYKAYTRTTTYIDVLDDKSNLEQWLMRMVLVGVARDTRLLEDVEGIYYDQQTAEKFLKCLPREATKDEIAEAKSLVKKPKDLLNRKAQIAKEKAGAEDKANKGTELHALSELVDMGKELPHLITFEDVCDLDAYKRMSKGFKIVHMEKLVVSDELTVAGTPDRASVWVGEEPLIAPDGTVFESGSGDMLITDLKTGTVEFGGLKMAMQLAIYANSELYDPQTGERSPLERINRKWGIIMNVPAGTGRGDLYWADLELGWEAVKVAGMVRRLRNIGKHALKPLDSVA